VIVGGKSSTSGIKIIPLTITFENLPTAAPAASGGVPTVDGSNNVHGLQTNVTVGTNSDKTGYSLSQSFPANFSSLGISSGGHISNVDTLANAPSDSSGVTTLLGRVTSARAGYFDNLNIGGIVASHSDITSLNTASPFAQLVAGDQYQIPATGNATYQITLLLNNDQGVPTNADGGTFTTTVKNAAGTDRSGNLSSWSNPATGKYTATYTVASSATAEQLVIIVTGTVSSVTFNAAAEPLVSAAFSLDFNSTDRSNLTAIYNLLPTTGNNIGDATIANQNTITGQTNKFAFDGSNNVKSTPQTNVTVGGYATGQDPGTYMTNQGYTTTRAAYLDTLSGIVSAIWSAGTRTLSGFGSLVSSIASAILKTPANLIGTNSDNSVQLPNPPPNGYGGSTALGPLFVNQNTGGTDNLRYVDSLGNGVDGATIVIFQATDWPANPQNALAVSTTGPDGRWTTPVYLPSGTYVAVFSKPGADGPDVSSPFSL
jgi:hypothetical protein